MRSLLILAAATAGLVAGCGGPPGPLAMVAHTTGYLASNGGVLEITDRCTFFRLEDRRTLLVWPQDRTSWNPQTRTITFGAGGWSVELHDGQSIAVGGVGSSKNGDGLTGEAWAARVAWEVPPAPECLADSRLFISDVVPN